jgi:hypothetical protein
MDQVGQPATMEQVKVDMASEADDLRRDPPPKLSLHLSQLLPKEEGQGPGGGEGLPPFCSLCKLQPAVGGLFRGYPEGFCPPGRCAAKLPEYREI